MQEKEDMLAKLKETLEKQVATSQYKTIHNHDTVFDCTENLQQTQS